MKIIVIFYKVEKYKTIDVDTAKDTTEERSSDNSEEMQEDNLVDEKKVQPVWLKITAKLRNPQHSTH